MFDVPTLSALATSLSSATTLTKTILGMKIDQEVISKVSALQSEIMSAQSAALAGIAERMELFAKTETLEKKLRLVDDWKEEASRYRLTTFPTGAQVYVLVAEKADGEPEHRVCPNCFQTQRKSLLQTIARVRGGEVVDCPNCKLRLELIQSGPAPRIEVDNGFY